MTDKYTNTDIDLTIIGKKLDTLEETAFKLLNEKLKDTEINASSVVLVLQYAMEIVELSEAKGAAQKELALTLVRRVIVDAPITDDKEKFLLELVDSDVLGNTVDFVVSASRGTLDINAATEVAKVCCLPFF